MSLLSQWLCLLEPSAWVCFIIQRPCIMLMTLRQPQACHAI